MIVAYFINNITTSFTLVFQRILEYNPGLFIFYYPQTSFSFIFYYHNTGHLKTLLVISGHPGNYNIFPCFIGGLNKL